MTANNEIIILKRITDTEDIKKGGVWKIAHADFMTALMAFFLIMWLVNATDEEIKKSIANYFNPMNLMDAPTDTRGLADPDDDARPPASGDEAGHSTGNRPMGVNTPGEGGGALGGGNVEEGNERRMDSAGISDELAGAAFHDPYAVLASAAADLAPEEPVAIDVPQSTLGNTGATRMSDEPRDPFDPAYWQTESARPARSLRPGSTEAVAAVPDGAIIDASDRTPTGEGQPTPAAQVEQSQGVADAFAAHGGGTPEAVGGGVGPRSTLAEAVIDALSGEPEDAEDRSPTDATEASVDPVEAAATAIAAALSTDNIELDVDVTAGPSSVLISLTDDGAFSMFGIGSAEPHQRTTALFGRVAAALAERAGHIVVRGHTDARAFAAGTSDNWVLSFERAHAAKQALVANGVAEDRIVRVEGLADREPKASDDPFADENRRIEILYEPEEVSQ